MSTPENKKSHSDAMALPKLSVAATATGASPDVAGILDDDPMCMHTVVAVSWQAAKNGSQWPVWMLGSPRWGGISLKHTAWQPRAAVGRTSSAASDAPQRGVGVGGR